MVVSYSRHERRINLRRDSSRAWLILAGFCVLATLGGVVWWLRPRGVEWAAKRGVALLATAHSPADRENALRSWEDETRDTWLLRRDALTDYLLKHWAEPDVPALLARAAQVDFGDRKEDWDRFRTTIARQRKGEQPTISAGERVSLKFKWVAPAPVGLTAWFSSIITLDGQIYVASLGRKFDEPGDDADAVVRVDGSTGESDVFFTPDGRGSLDVVGLAAGKQCLYVAVRNGNVYCVDLGGKRRWSASAGAPLLSPPVSVALHGDDSPDLVVMTAQHRVIAFAASTGKPLWQREVIAKGGRTEDEPAAYTTLAAGRVWSGNEINVVATLWNGTLTVLGPNGEVRWTTNDGAGAIAGSICRRAESEGAATLFVADRDGRVRSYGRSGRVMKELNAWNADPTGRAGVVANLRTLRSRQPDVPPMLVSVTTAGAETPQGTLSGLGPNGVVWRTPLRGSAWSTPAIADISGDGKPEIIVLCNGPEPESAKDAGWLQVFNSDGHLVLDYLLPPPSSPVDSAPLVADVDDDGRLEVLWADRAGLLYCFGTGRTGPVEWGCVGGDARNSCNADFAFGFGQTPAGYQRKWKPD